MNQAGNQTLMLPMMLITVGTGWLLSALDVAPGINWIWILGLGLTAIMILLLGGWDKVTFVASMFLFAISCLSILRQAGRLSLDLEMPVLVILAGVLILIARHSSIPMPEWITPEPKSAQ